MKRYAIRIFYDGANYHGYQRQPDLFTVEGTLIEALIKTGYIESPDKNNFRSASRTDRYVSAIGNVFAFNSEKEIILDQLNASLPSDNSIICWSYACVDEDFTPKYSSAKKYWYVLPLNYVKTIKGMDRETINEICSRFIGEHDFKLFCKLDHRDTLRKIEEFSLSVKKDLAIFEIKASSFLWEQVRRLVGYILSFNTLSESFQNTEQLLQTDTQITNLNIEPANPEQLILVKHFYDNMEWKLSNKAVDKIVTRSDELLSRLKQKENLVSSIFDFFTSNELE